MKKSSDRKNSKDYSKFTPQTKTNNKADKLFLKSFIHKNTASYIPTKLKNVESKIFMTEYNFNNINKNINKKLNISLYDVNNNYNYNNNNSNLKDSNPKIYSYKRRSSLNPSMTSSSLKRNLFSNCFNIMNFFRKNKNPKIKATNFLPNINSQENNIQSETSFKMKNNNKDAFKKSKFYIRTNSIIDKIQNKRISSQNINIKNLKKGDIDLSTHNKSAKKYLKMKTFLNLNREIDLLTNKLKKEKERKRERNEEDEEENDEEKRENNKKRKRTYQNQELLYSKKISGYILKIYKAVPEKKNINKKEDKIGKKKLKKKNNKKPKFTIKDYINSFNPKKYIKKIDNKISKGEIGNLNDDKKKLLDRTLNYIDFYIYKNNKLYKKKQDILEKVKDKNRHLINKCKKELIKKLINELLLKINLKHKHTIFKFHMESLLISQFIEFHIYVKLNIMRHVLTNSEHDENIYFINLIKHLLYKGKKKITIRYPFIKCYGNIVSPYITRTTTVDRFIDLNKKSIYYLYFCIKYELLDCETIINSSEENEFTIMPKKMLKVPNISSIKETISSLERSNSTIHERIKIRRRTRGTTILNKNNNYKLAYNLKLMNINLTKNIINLGKENIEDAINNKTSLNLKNINNFYKKNTIDEFSDSSDSIEFNRYNKNTKHLEKNNDIILTKGGIKDDNEEIHQRDRKLLYEHFLSCVEFSLYDKLYHCLKRWSRYMDLNFQLDNGDTLLHLCVRYSVPHFIYRLLITHGVNINAQNNQGDTALHLAVKEHKYKTIDLLIKLGASEYIYNNMDKNCWECL